MPARSAGILMYRRREAGLEVLLVHPGGPFFARRDAGVWSVPKGEYGPGEQALDCALREFAEETGHAPAPVGLIELGEVRQRSGKIVTAWAIEGELDAQQITSNTFLLEWPPGSGRRQAFPEVDRAAWLALPEAGEKILAAQRPLIQRLAAAVNPRPVGSQAPVVAMLACRVASAPDGPHSGAARRTEDTMTDDEQEGSGDALGDTPEVHDTIHPGDLPPGHPGRPAAEEKLAEAKERHGDDYEHEGGVRP